MDRKCWDCGESKPDSDFYDKKNQCKQCRNAYVRQWKANNRERAAEIRRKSYSKRRAEDPLVAIKTQLNAAKYRARRKGVPFEITVDDLPPVPELCPALGIPLDRSGGKNSDNLPEIDRIIPELGYVPGNVAWLSRRANTIKNDAKYDEIFNVAEWLRKHVCST